MKIVKIDNPKRVEVKRKGSHSYWEIGDVIHPCGDESFFAVLSGMNEERMHKIMWKDGKIGFSGIENCSHIGYMGINYKIDFELTIIKEQNE